MKLRVLAILLLGVGNLACVLATIPALPTPPAQIANTFTPLPTRAPTPLPTSPPVLATVLATALHIRSGPGVSYPVIGWLFQGDTITILSCRGAWAQIPGGWVNANFVDKHCGDFNHAKKR